MRGVVVLAILFLASCASSKLKRAERLIAKAVAQGAKVQDDTVYARVEFKAPEMRFETRLAGFRWGDTLYLPGKSGPAEVITRIVRKPGTNRVDTVVVVKCPEQGVETTTPVAIDRKIEAGYTFWNVLFWFFVGLVVGFAIHFILRVVKILP